MCCDQASPEPVLFYAMDEGREVLKPGSRQESAKHHNILANLSSLQITEVRLFTVGTPKFVEWECIERDVRLCSPLGKEVEDSIVGLSIVHWTRN